MRAAADEALRTVGLANKAGQDYLTLSGGEKQLCILARTIAEDASLLLLDEPDSALAVSYTHLADGQQPGDFLDGPFLGGHQFLVVAIPQQLRLAHIIGPQRCV